MSHTVNSLYIGELESTLVSYERIKKSEPALRDSRLYERTLALARAIVVY